MEPDGALEDPFPLKNVGRDIADGTSLSVIDHDGWPLTFSVFEKVDPEPFSGTNDRGGIHAHRSERIHGPLADRVVGHRSDEPARHSKLGETHGHVRLPSSVDGIITACLEKAL